MNKKEQYDNTNLMLRQAFYRLMNDFKVPSVDDICKEANIHHQTFYKHFQTKQEFYIHVCNVNENLFYNKYKDLNLLDFIKQILEKGFCKQECFIPYLKDDDLSKLVYLSLKDSLSKKLDKENKFSLDEKKFILGGLIFYILESFKNTDVALADAILGVEVIFNKLNI